MVNSKQAIEAIRLKEGGERLYIFAIANKKDVLPVLRSRKCRYLTTSEFEFYENDYVLNKDSLFYQINKWFVRKHLILCRAYTLYKQFQLAAQLWWTSNPFPQYYWPSDILYQPVLADRVWSLYSKQPSRISVNGQIAISSEWSDTYYLNPSQKYLKARVDQWIKKSLRRNVKRVPFISNIQILEKQNKEKSLDYIMARNLQEWLRQCRQDGYEITYLASLDT